MRIYSTLVRKIFSEIILSTVESYISFDHNISLKSFLRELETEVMALKSFVLKHFFIIKQSAKINTEKSLPTLSGDDNTVLIMTLVDQIEYLKKELCTRKYYIMFIEKW